MEMGLQSLLIETEEDFQVVPNESALSCIPIFEAGIREPVGAVSGYQIGNSH
jgi:hypothetical protein